jgi:hypothetical protein
VAYKWHTYIRFCYLALYIYQSEDLKVPNSFGRRILELCKSTGLRICNGRFGVDSSKFTFQNKNGCSVIDYLLISSDCIYSLIKQVNC